MNKKNFNVYSVPEFRLKARLFGLHLRVLRLVEVRLLLPFLALLLRLLLLVKHKGQSEKSRSYLSRFSPPPTMGQTNQPIKRAENMFPLFLRLLQLTGQTNKPIKRTENICRFFSASFYVETFRKSKNRSRN
jgi:hypothetical protein